MCIQWWVPCNNRAHCVHPKRDTGLLYPDPAIDSAVFQDGITRWPEDQVKRCKERGCNGIPVNRSRKEWQTCQACKDGKRAPPDPHRDTPCDSWDSSKPAASASGLSATSYQHPGGPMGYQGPSAPPNAMQAYPAPGTNQAKTYPHPNSYLNPNSSANPYPNVGPSQYVNPSPQAAYPYQIPGHQPQTAPNTIYSSAVSAPRQNSASSRPRRPMTDQEKSDQAERFEAIEIDCRRHSHPHDWVVAGRFNCPKYWREERVPRDFTLRRFEFAFHKAPEDPGVLPYETRTAFLRRQVRYRITNEVILQNTYNAWSYDRANLNILPADAEGDECRDKQLQYMNEGNPIVGVYDL